jgi:hypothetical protein
MNIRHPKYQTLSPPFSDPPEPQDACVRAFDSLSIDLLSEYLNLLEVCLNLSFGNNRFYINIETESNINQLELYVI